MDCGGRRILVCHGPDCGEGGSEEILRLFNQEISRHRLEKRVLLIEYSCFGQCQSGPNVVIGACIADPDPIFGEGAYIPGTKGESLYCRVRPNDVLSLFQEHVIEGRPVRELLLRQDPP